MLWVCASCTTRYAVGLGACPNDGGRERAPDHEVDQIQEQEMAAKITAGGGASYPMNRPGEGAPRRFTDDAGNEVESAGREPTTTDTADTSVVAEGGEYPNLLPRPAGNATTAAWIEYADQEDPGTDHTELTRAELIELYGAED